MNDISSRCVRQRLTGGKEGGEDCCGEAYDVASEGRQLGREQK